MSPAPEAEICIGFIIGVAVTFAFMLFLGGGVDGIWRGRMVERGCASYDPITGEFQMIEPKSSS